jgi:hypothetical protein
MVRTRLGEREMPVYAYTTLDDSSRAICKVYSMTSSAWASSVADSASRFTAGAAGSLNL